MTTFKFNTLAAATDFANRSFGNMIILGNDNLFWVVSRKAAARLQKQGYELA